MSDSTSKPRNLSTAAMLAFSRVKIWAMFNAAMLSDNASQLTQTQGLSTAPENHTEHSPRKPLRQRKMDLRIPQKSPHRQCGRMWSREAPQSCSGSSQKASPKDPMTAPCASLRRKRPLKTNPEDEVKVRHRERRPDTPRQHLWELPKGSISLRTSAKNH